MDAADFRSALAVRTEGRSGMMNSLL